MWHELSVAQAINAGGSVANAHHFRQFTMLITKDADRTAEFYRVQRGKYERQEEPNQIYERQDFCLVASKNNSSPCMSSLFGANWPLHALLALLQKKVTSLRLIRATIATSCELRVRAFTLTKLQIIRVAFASLSLLPVLVSLNFLRFEGSREAQTSRAFISLHEKRPSFLGCLARRLVLLYE